MQMVQLFSRNLANKETNKLRYKEINRKQYPVPRCIGDGVTKAREEVTIETGEFCFITAVRTVVVRLKIKQKGEYFKTCSVIC